MNVVAVRAKLDGQLSDLLEVAAGVEAERPTESIHIAHVSQHPADYGTELSDAEREQAVLNSVEREIGQIRLALARLDEGTYGTCVVCGKKIPAARLQARPEAIRCMEHQEAYEKARN
jgi:RNA polymerase-binding transcription factor DksA